MQAIVDEAMHVETGTLKVRFGGLLRAQTANLGASCNVNNAWPYRIMNSLAMRCEVLRLSNHQATAAANARVCSRLVLACICDSVVGCDQRRWQLHAWVSYARDFGAPSVKAEFHFANRSVNAAPPRLPCTSCSNRSDCLVWLSRLSPER